MFSLQGSQNITGHATEHVFLLYRIEALLSSILQEKMAIEMGTEVGVQTRANLVTMRTLCADL